MAEDPEEELREARTLLGKVNAKLAFIRDDMSRAVLSGRVDCEYRLRVMRELKSLESQTSGYQSDDEASDGED